MGDPETSESESSSTFYQLMSKDGAVSLLDALLTRHYTELSAADLSERTGYDITRVENLLSHFEGHGIIRRTDDGGVMLVKEAESVQAFKDAHASLTVGE